VKKWRRHQDEAALNMLVLTSLSNPKLFISTICQIENCMIGHVFLFIFKGQNKSLNTGTLNKMEKNFYFVYGISRE